VQLVSIRVLNNRPKYPPIKDGRQVCYMLLHLSVPSNRHPVRSSKYLNGLKSADKAGKDLGVRVWPVRVYWKNHRGDYRYFFCFPRLRRDDERALLIGESVLYAVSLTSGPFWGAGEATPVFRVPIGLTRNRLDFVHLGRIARHAL
jgi:hypothetical protein